MLCYAYSALSLCKLWHTITHWQQTEGPAGCLHAKSINHVCLRYHRAPHKPSGELERNRVMQRDIGVKRFHAFPIGFWTNSITEPIIYIFINSLFNSARFHWSVLFHIIVLQLCSLLLAIVKGWGSSHRTKGDHRRKHNAQLWNYKSFTQVQKSKIKQYL